MSPSTPPPTVWSDSHPLDVWHVSLDGAIQETLENSKILRVLQGVTVTSSGRSLYDVAIANTRIDDQRGRFDPKLNFSSTTTHNESPFFNGFSQSASAFPADTTVQQFGLSKTNPFGGTASISYNDTSFFSPLNTFSLNPRHNQSVGLAYSQPLLQGMGRKANLAPIVIARIDAEKSFFDMKDSLQELVRGTIEAYWSLVAARTDLWAREKQVEQGRFSAELARGRRSVGLANVSEVSQADLALANFEAAYITSQAAVYQREATLRNLIGLPPGDHRQIVPVSTMQTDEIRPDWDALVALAEESRPDIIQLKLILDADQQNLLIAKNQMLPRADLTTSYRWNGITGQLQDGGSFSSFGPFTSWSVGINFSVPLGLRQGRANVRNREFIILRDQSNLEQGLHNAIHRIGFRYRQVAQSFRQYQAFHEVRTMARLNLSRQAEQYRSGRAIFLNVLQAITDWGNAVRQEADALAAYNTELANLEREVGSILEDHGIRLVEERQFLVGPMLFKKPYPVATLPTLNANRYPSGLTPSERAIVPDTIEEEVEGIDPKAPRPPASQLQEEPAAEIDQTTYFFQLWNIK